MARRHRIKTKECPNCGTDLRAAYEFCPTCGQENHDLRLPFRHFLYEFIENLAHFDTKLWNTLKVIFTRPGQLTKDFVEGKRARYVNPARFYVFISVIFFALLTIRMDRSLERATVVTTEASDVYRRTASLIDVVRHGPGDPLDQERLKDLDLRLPIDRPYYRTTADRLRTASPSLLDSLLTDAEDTLSGTRTALRNALGNLPVADSLNVPYRVLKNGLLTSFTKRSDEALMSRGDISEAGLDSLLGMDVDSVSWIERRAIRSLARLDLATPTGKKQFGHNVVKAVSIIMFILMPFTAVLLLWFFYRKRFYWEHLIFSVHTHTILFLFFSILLVIALMLPEGLPGLVTLPALVICLIYLLVSLRRVYARSWLATFGRFLMMGIPYIVVSTILFITGMLWGFFSL